MSGVRRQKHHHDIRFPVGGVEDPAITQHSTFASHTAQEVTSPHMKRTCVAPITHNCDERIHYKHVKSSSRKRRQTLLCGTPGSLVELLQRSCPDDSRRHIPLTRQSHVQRVVRIQIHRPARGTRPGRETGPERGTGTDRGTADPHKKPLKWHAPAFTKQRKVAKQSKTASFPEKLYAILEEPDLADVIAWTPRGTSWRVLQTYHLQEFVLPRYFRSERYTSFMRQVTGWGFKRLTEGPEMHAYYHPLFMRGRPDLVKQIRRPQKASDESTLTSASMAAHSPAESQSPRLRAPTLLLRRCESPEIEMGTVATSQVVGDFHRTVRVYNDGTMREEPQLLGTSQSSCPLTPPSQVSGNTLNASEAYRLAFGGSSGSDSDEDFQNVLAHTDRLVLAALRAQPGSQNPSPDTSPLSATQVENYSIFPTTPPSLHRQLTEVSENKGSMYVSDPLMPNL